MPVKVKLANRRNRSDLSGTLVRVAVVIVLAMGIVCASV